MPTHDIARDWFVIISALFAAMIAGCACQRLAQSSDAISSDSSHGRLVVILFPVEDRRPYISRNPKAIEEIWNWYQNVSKGQPAPDMVGAVQPWFEITFYREATPYSQIMRSDKLFHYYDSSSPPAMSKENIRQLMQLLEMYPSSAE